AMAMALCAAVMGSSPAASREAQTASSFCAGLNKAVTPLIGGADAVFIRSYEPGMDEASLPAGIATTAFVYDNALAVIALIACGDGFCGGFHGYDPQQVKLTWMSTEHNVDVHAAARWLFSLTGEQKYAGAARQARGLLDRTFRGDHFLLGTKPDGRLADEGVLALDVQLWPWMAVPEAPAAWRNALRFAQAHLAVDNGFDFNGDRDGVWVEGMAQAELAYRISGDTTRSDRLLAGLKADQTRSGLLNASRTARLTTGLSIDPTGTVPDFFYY